MSLKIPREMHHHDTLKFPDGFLWGTATSAYQIEGENIHSDWWAWEQKNQPEDKRSGKAADHYHLYEQDFDLAKEYDHNCHRLSVEWSRIEPNEGEFNESEIKHYREVLKSLKKRGMKIMLTIWHFTIPKWVSDKGGWENRETEKYYLRFVEKIADEFKDDVDFWVTINEPGVYIYTGYLKAMWPPQKRSKIAALRVYWNLAQAHKKAYALIHKIKSSSKVGIANNVASFDAFHKHSISEDLAVWFLDKFGNHLFYKLTGIGTHDFLGLNYYLNHYISFDKKAKLPDIVDISVTKKDVSDLGWEIYPEGIFDIIMDFSDYHKPIYITENGLASTNDDRRCRMLISYLKEIYHAIATGADVRGYFHWSLIDNFEWADGYRPRFGLVAIDYETLERLPRPSAEVYSEVIRHNGIPHYLMRFIGHTVEAEEVLNYPQTHPH